jgi:hypothetical protein
VKNGRTTPARKKLTLVFGILAMVALGFFGYEFWQWILPSPPLPSATGSFSVSSVPSGAVVHWKGRELGHTPLRQYVLPPGDQVIELTTPGYQPCPIEFTINAGLVVDLGVRSLAKQLGKLRLVTEPAGVFYSVVGPDKKTIAGITPDTIENLPLGRYDVKLLQPGWPDYTQAADINSGEPVEVSRQFKGGSVELTSDPSGATIFVGGSKLGTAPLSANLPLVPVEVTSSFGALGSVVQTLVPDPERTVSFHFKHSYGTLLVSSDRADAVLIVDGLDFGHPPAQLFLAPGNHKLLLSAPSAPDKTRRVDLIEGQHVNVQIDFGGANGEVAAVANSAGSPTPTPSPAPPNKIASTSATPTPASTPPLQLAARTTPTPQPVSSPSPGSNRIGGSSFSPSPTPQKPISGSEEQPAIPPVNSEGTPLPALTPGPESPKPLRTLSRSAALAKKESVAATPSLDPEQAKSKAEAHQLLNAQAKANEEALRTEKRYLDYQIKNSSGAAREQWKYQLAQWRLKKTRAKQDRAAQAARVKEEWR